MKSYFKENTRWSAFKVWLAKKMLGDSIMINMEISGIATVPDGHKTNTIVGNRIFPHR